MLKSMFVTPPPPLPFFMSDCMFKEGTMFTCKKISETETMFMELSLVFVQHTTIIHVTDWLTEEKRSNASNSKIKTLIEWLSPSISSSTHFLKDSWPCLLTSSHQSLFAWHQIPHTQTHVFTCMHSHSNTPTPRCNPPPKNKTHWVNFSPPSVRTHTAANAEIKARHWRIH